jgi:hypothetical protein
MQKKPTFFLLALIAVCFELNASNFYTSSAGNWTAVSNWVSNKNPGNYWGVGDTVFVNHAMTLNANIGFAGVLIISSSGSLTGTARNLSLYNNAYALFEGAVSVQDIALNSKSSVDATATVSGRNLDIQTGSSFNTTKSVTLSGNLEVNDGTFSSTSSLSVSGDFEINSGGTANISGAVVVGNDMTLNSSTNSTFGSTVTIGNNFEANSSASAVFNGKVAVGNDATFNSGTSISINAPFNVTNDIEINGATVAISSSGTMTAGVDVVINSSSTITNAGTISAADDITLNGGTITNTGNFIAGDDITHNSGASLTNNSPGRIEAGDDYTKNGGTLTNNHHMVVGDRFTNYGGTTDGNGKLQVENIYNTGNITGTLDICRANGTPPTISGSGSMTGGVTLCLNPLSFPLPVELLSFAGRLDRDVVELTWVTASEYRNAFFTLERRNSIGAFEFLAEIAGAGTTNSTSEYTWIDDNIGSDEMYYRLSQTDEDGTVTYLKIILVELLDEVEKEQTMKVFPNPFKDELYISGATTDIVSVTICNAGGQQLLQIENADLPSNPNKVLGLPSYHAGIYFLEILTLHGVHRFKIIRR